MDNKTGTILIISLWILVIVSLLCLSLARQVIAGLRSTTLERDEFRCLYAAKSAVQEAICSLADDSTLDRDTLYELQDKSRHENDLSGEADAILGAAYSYTISDEQRKININKADKKLLVALFDLLAVSDAESLAQNIIYQRGTNAPGYQGDYYEISQMSSGRAREPFMAIEELYLIKGLKDKPDILEKCRRFFTVYTPGNFININTAEPLVLEAIFISLGAEEVNRGLSLRLANSIVEYRSGGDQKESTQDDSAIKRDEIKKIFKAGALDTKEENWIEAQFFPFITKSDLFTVEVFVRLDNSRVKKKVAIIVDRSQNPTEIKYWYEE
jgi:type II secretory pathway component PulK